MFKNQVIQQYLFYKWSTMFFIVANIFIAAIVSTSPFAMEYALKYYEDDNLSSLLIFSTLYFFLLMFTSWFTAFTNTKGRLLQNKVSNRLRCKMMEHNLYLNLSQKTNSELEKETSKIISDSEISTNMYYNVPKVLFRFSFSIIIGLYYLFYWDFVLAITITLLLLSLILINHFFHHRTFKNALNTQEQNSVLYRQSRISNQHRLEIKLQNTESYELTKFNNTSVRVKNTKDKYWKELNFPRLMTWLVGDFIKFSPICIMVTVLLTPLTRTPVTWAPLILSTSLISSQIFVVETTIREFLISSTSQHRVNKFFNLSKEDNFGTLKKQSLEGSIEFVNVSFSFNGNKIFSNFNLKIEPKEKVAVIGPSGCGKSTLFNLLIRLYDVDSGDILIDGISIYDYELASLRKHFGYIQQDVTLFDDTIENNISHKNTHLSKTSAQKAFASDFILQTPNKYKTFITSTGDSLSGGQQQRLMFARLFSNNNQIILLDESSRSLDYDMKLKIEKQLFSFSQDKTLISITHDTPSPNKYDRIVVLESIQNN